jgi:lysophospholipid acyltransferase (LPLAT)-like uncharacterized protein
MKLELKYKIAVFLLNMLSKTWRIRIMEGDIPEKPAIIVFWHGLMLPGWKLFEGKNPKAIVSLSKDGEILSSLLKKWGFEVIRGSSSKNGKEALELIINNAVDNYVLITPDGPQGPANKMKAGAVVACQRSGTKLYLCGITINSKKIFNKSWDKFQLPYPFSIVNIRFSEAIEIEKSLDKKEITTFISKYEIKLLNLSKIE